MKQKMLLGNNNFSYADLYDKSFLQAIKRSLARESIQNLSNFYGYDIWHCYEFSFLNLNGLPQNYILQICIKADSEFIVESKSLKLYLFSFSNTKFINNDDVIATIENDLNELLHTQIKASLIALNSGIDFSDISDYSLIDECSTNKITCYDVNAGLLTIDDKIKVNEKLCSHIVKTLCPVTSQPDYASIFIEYSGYAIDKSSLLAYLVSFRNHQGFHEQCTEMIYSDLMTQCHCEKLLVYASFTRRGGIDINPIRASYSFEPFSLRTTRQ